MQLRSFIVLAFFFLITNIADAQKYTAQFKNGSDIDFEVPVNDPERNHKYWFGMPLQLDRYVINIAEARVYFSPKIIFRGVLGYSYGGESTQYSGGLYANYFLTSKTVDHRKESKIRIKLDQYTGTKYFIRHLLKVKKSFGIKGGIEYYRTPMFTYPSVVFGINTNKLKFFRIVTFNNGAPAFIQGTQNFSLNFDVVYYPTVASHKQENETSVGYKLYGEGFWAFPRKRAWGICYSLGFATGYTKSGGRVPQFLPVYGIGIFGAFGKR